MTPRGGPSPGPAGTRSPACSPPEHRCKRPEAARGRLEDDGLVTHRDEGGRKIYRLTPAGRQELTRRHRELNELEAEITGSLRGLAREVRDEVRGSVQDLRAELKGVARQVRREERATARRGGDGRAELQAMLAGLGREVLAAAPPGPLSDKTRRRCRAAVDRARADFLHALGQPT